MRDDGTMMRTPELMEKAKEWGLKIITIKDLQDYCRRHDKHVVREACAKMPTRFGEFRIYGYVNDLASTMLRSSRARSAMARTCSAAYTPSA